MNTLRTLIAVCFAAACAYSVQAQTGRSEQVKDSTLNRTVVVEQEYIPHITDVRKMDVLPRVEQPVATSRMVRYADELRPVSRVPSSAMPSYSGNEEQPMLPVDICRQDMAIAEMWKPWPAICWI